MYQSIYGKIDIYSKSKINLQSEFEKYMWKRSFTLTIAFRYEFCKNNFLFEKMDSSQQNCKKIVFYE